MMKQMASLPHTADYQPYEADLKRKLIRAQHRVMGVFREGSPVYALAAELPVCYQYEVVAFMEQCTYLLKVLSDVEVGAAQ